MKKAIILATFVLGYFLIGTVIPVFGEAGPLGKVAIFTEQAGWIAHATAVEEGKELADLLKNPEKVVTLTDKEIGPWAEENTDNGFSDIIVTFGWFPTTLYTPGNVQIDDSIAERFLYGGNIIFNCADYAFYVTEGGGANGENGLKTIININADMWGGGTQITPTDLGAEYTPTLENFTSERPFKSEQIVDPWTVEAIFGDNGETFFDPGIIKLNDNSGRVGICMQEPNRGDLPRGQVLIEMIDFISQQADVATPVEPAGKATTTWGNLKSLQ